MHENTSTMGGVGEGGWLRVDAAGWWWLGVGEPLGGWVWYTV